MGQSLKTLAPAGSEGQKIKLGEIAQTYYDKHHSKVLREDCTFDDFYRAICEAVEAINTKFGYTQLRVPKRKVLEDAFNEHHKGEEVTEEEFQKIMKDVILDTGFTGFGAKDILLYIFGVPVTALLVKQGVMPKAIPNAFFIPAVTSATALVLSYLNKL